MKITVHIKDPDGFYDSVKNSIEEDVDQISDLDDDEKEQLVERRFEKVWDKLEKFVEFKECMTVEFDTDAGTATVVPRKS